LTALSSAQQSNAMSRERIAATNAIRGYIEDMRQKFPTTSTSADMSGFMADTTTPVAYIASGSSTGDAVEKAILLDPQALVLKGNDETGVTWGTSTASSGWLWTDATLASTGAVSLSVSAAAKVSAFNSGAIDLDADGTTATTAVANNKLVRVPCEITLCWRTAAVRQSGTPTGLNATQYARQRITVYAVFSVNH